MFERASQQPWGGSLKARCLIMLAAGLASCSGGSPTAVDMRRSPEPLVAAVLFTYRSPVPRGQPPPADPEIAGSSLGCVHHYSAMGGGYVLNGSWFPNTTFRNPEGDCHEGCAFVVAGVPVGTFQVVRVWDLNLCNVDPSIPPLSYRTIMANGVELTRVIDHPSGMRGAAFAVSVDGKVTP